MLYSSTPGPAHTAYIHSRGGPQRLHHPYPTVHDSALHTHILTTHARPGGRTIHQHQGADFTTTPTAACDATQRRTQARQAASISVQPDPHTCLPTTLLRPAYKHHCLSATTLARVLTDHMHRQRSACHPHTAYPAHKAMHHKCKTLTKHSSTFRSFRSIPYTTTPPTLLLRLHKAHTACRQQNPQQAATRALSSGGANFIIWTDLHPVGSQDHPQPPLLPGLPLCPIRPMVWENERLAACQPHCLACCIIQPLYVRCRPALLPLQSTLLPLDHKLLHTLDYGERSLFRSPLACGSVCRLVLVLSNAAGGVLGAAVP
jgi:hypothetical protein